MYYKIETILISRVRAFFLRKRKRVTCYLHVPKKTSFHHGLKCPKWLLYFSAQLYASILHLKYCQNLKVFLKKGIFFSPLARTFMECKCTINLKILYRTFCYEMWTFLLNFIRIILIAFCQDLVHAFYTSEYLINHLSFSRY